MSISVSSSSIQTITQALERYICILNAAIVNSRKFSVLDLRCLVWLAWIDGVYIVIYEFLSCC